MAPCWTVMLNPPQSPAKADKYTSETSAISWLARNTSKPEREPTGENWVAQASPQWSIENLELSSDAVLDALLPEICATIGVPIAAVAYKTAHRWRYARVTKAVGASHISDPTSRLFLAGDWCLGPRVECAFQSGLAAAEAVIKRHQQT